MAKRLIGIAAILLLILSAASPVAARPAPPPPILDVQIISTGDTYATYVELPSFIPREPKSYWAAMMFSKTADSVEGCYEASGWTPLGLQAAGSWVERQWESDDPNLGYKCVRGCVLVNGCFNCIPMTPPTEVCIYGYTE